MQEAVEILKQFPQEWDALEGEPEEQQEPVEEIVGRVYIRDELVVALISQRHYGPRGHCACQRFYCLTYR